MNLPIKTWSFLMESLTAIGDIVVRGSLVSFSVILLRISGSESLLKLMRFPSLLSSSRMFML
jgi:hypothetical protein